MRQWEREARDRTSPNQRHTYRAFRLSLSPTLCASPLAPTPFGSTACVSSSSASIMSCSTSSRASWTSLTPPTLPSCALAASASLACRFRLRSAERDTVSPFPGAVSTGLRDVCSSVARRAARLAALVTAVAAVCGAGASPASAAADEDETRFLRCGPRAATGSVEVALRRGAGRPGIADLAIVRCVGVEVMEEGAPRRSRTRGVEFDARLCLGCRRVCCVCAACAAAALVLAAVALLCLL